MKTFYIDDPALETGDDYKFVFNGFYTATFTLTKNEVKIIRIAAQMINKNKDNNIKLDAIILIREILGCGLFQAKAIAESLGF